MNDWRMEETPGDSTLWVNESVARVLFCRKHALPILLFVYNGGSASTSELIRLSRGHPKAIINTIRVLESFGVLRRARLREGRHPVENRLTPRGIQLVETPLCRWYRLLRKWDLASE